MGGGNHRIGRVDRGFEAEGFVDEVDVVVDGLGDADHADVEAAPFDFHCDVVRAAQRAVAADAEQDFDVHALERFNHRDLVLAAAGAAEHGAADLMDAVHRIRGQQHRLVAERRDQPLIAVPDAEHDRHVVPDHQRAGQPLDHVVESGAEPAGGQDRRMGPRRIVIDLFARPGLFESAEPAVFVVLSDHFVGVFSVDHGRVLGNKLHPGQRRIDRRFPEAFYSQIRYGHISFSKKFGRCAGCFRPGGRSR